MLDWSDALLNNKELYFPFPDNLNKIILKDIIPDEYLYFYTLDEGKNVDKLKKIRKAVAEYIGPFSEGLAFYLSGKRIKDGKPILGFNLNSNLSQYPKWYPVYMAIGDKKMACITASGLPFIYFGSSETMSFAGFNLKVDTQDFCGETIKKIDDQKYYLGRGRWNKLNVSEEKIFTDPERSDEYAKKIHVYSTDGGAILSSIPDDSETSYISIKSILPDEKYIMSLFDIPFAGDLQSAASLLKNISSNPKVYLFTDYNTAVIAHSGMVPARDINNSVFKNNPETAWKSVTDISAGGLLKESKDMIIGDQYFTLPKNIEGLISCRDNSRFSRLQLLLENDRLNERKGVEEILLDSHSPIAEKFTPLFVSILDTISITSSRLSRIYFNQWDSSVKAGSVPSVIFTDLLRNTISMTISDDIENYHEELMDNHDKIIDKFYALMSEGKSFIFDDLRTKSEIEDRDSLFRRAFLRTLRQLNERYGPIMNNWKWKTTDSAPYKIPLLSTGFFSKIQDSGKYLKSGGFHTTNMGTINSINMPGAFNVSSLSGIFHGRMLYLSQSFSSTMDPESDYFKNNVSDNKFTRINRERPVHTFRIIPQSKKFSR
jgi:acyl-homoserine lactone acylase PvdQ